MRFLRSPLYVFVFLLFLSGIQVNAFRQQFVQGFVPFKNPPVRVAFSWDMFSTHVERCVVEWSPPIVTPLGTFGSLRRLGTSLEWDVIYDHVRDYHEVGQLICRINLTPEVRSTVKFRCFLPNGTTTQEEVPCA